MKNHMQKLILAPGGLLLAALGTSAVQAEIITFEGVAPAGGAVTFQSPPPYIEKGFEFSGGEDFRVLSNTYPNYQIDNGSDNGFNQTILNFTIQAVDGGPFAITCFDAGPAFGVSPGEVVVTGLTTGGPLGGATHVALSGGAFSTFELPALLFTNMLRADFSHTTPFLAIDNICLEKRAGLWADAVVAMLPTQFAGSEFHNGTIKVVGDGVEFSNRYNNGLIGFDLDLNESGFTFTFFNNREGTFNPGITGLELTDLDLAIEPINPIMGITLEPGSTFPAGTFNNVTIGADSIIFAMSNIIINSFQVMTATFKIQSNSNTIWSNGFEDDPVPGR